MAKSFDELVARKTSKGVQAQAAALTRKYLAEMLLSEVRTLNGKSQKELAAALKIKQPSLSKLEGQDDMQISTLQKIIEALGGRLVIKAKFPNGQTSLKQFIRKHPATRKVRELKLVG